MTVMSTIRIEEQESQSVEGQPSAAFVIFDGGVTCHHQGVVLTDKSQQRPDL